MPAGVRFKNFEQAQKLFGPQIAQNAMRETLNRMAVTVSKVAKKGAFDTYNVPKPVINETFKITKARNKNLSTVIESSGFRIPIKDFNPTEKRLPGNFKGGFQRSKGVQTRKFIKSPAIYTKGADGKRYKLSKSRSVLASNIRRTKPTKRAKLGVFVKIKKKGSKKLIGRYGNLAFIGRGAKGGLGGSARIKGGGSFHVFVRKRGSKRLPIESIQTLSVPQMVGTPQSLENLSDVVTQRAFPVFAKQMEFFINKAIRQ